MSPGAFAFVLVLILGFGGCAGTEDAARPEGRPPVEVTAGGSRLLAPFMEKAGREYETGVRNVDVTIRRSGSEEGLDALCTSAVPIALTSRPIRASEREVCRSNGNIIRSLPLANEGLAVIAHPRLDITCLSTAQLRRLWRAGSSVDEYGDLGARLPDTPVTAFGLATDSESFAFFTRALVGTEGSMREDFRPARDPARVIDSVASTPGSVAYVGYAELERAKGRVRPVAIDDGRGCVLPSRRTIPSGRYAPLSRPLDAYVNLEGLRRFEVGRFLAYTVDRHRRLAEGSGVVPMSPDQARTATNVVGEPRPSQAVPAG